MNAFTFRFNQGLSLVALFAVSAAARSGAEPFVPSHDGQVLERVATARIDPAVEQLKLLRARLNAHPDDASAAAELVRRCIERTRAEGDPRYLGRAQAALRLWWESVEAPPEILVLRATIKQSQHDFTHALVDLDRAVRLAPSNAQAWLTRATVLTVLGRFDDARRCCLALARFAPELVVLTATANIASLTGQAEHCRNALVEALKRNDSAPVPERLWALTVLAETCARLGHTAEAERYYKQALAISDADVYLLGSFADFLLDHGRSTEAVALLQGKTRVDSLLLRLALAESAQAPVPRLFSEHLATLQSRFEELHWRGENIHQREEARLTLWLLHKPADALRLAQANWEVQREPADVRILLEAALQCEKPDAAAAALRFVDFNHLEDTRIRDLAAQLNKFPSDGRGTREGPSPALPAPSPIGWERDGERVTQ